MNSTAQETAAAVAVVELTKSNCKLVKKMNAKSDIWKHFRYYDAKLKLPPKWVESNPVCIHCWTSMKDSDVDPSEWEVHIGSTKSTGHLAVHIERKHREIYSAECLVKAETKGREGLISTFVRREPSLVAADRESRQLYAWCKYVVMSLMPIDTPEDPNLRSLILEHAKHDSHVVKFGSQRIKSKLIEIEAEVLIGVRELLRTESVAITTDCWTSSKFFRVMDFTS